MNMNNNYANMDNEGCPYVADIPEITAENTNFRMAVWTGCHLQMTVMSILPCEAIGWEIHHDTDQFIRVEQGIAVVKMGENKERPDICRKMCKGDGVFVPAGTGHNVINAGDNRLKLSSIYAPPNHPKGTIHHTRADADKEEHGYTMY